MKACVGTSWSPSLFTPPPRGGAPGTHRVGRWVDTRAGLDDVEKILYPTGTPTPTPRSSSSWSLYPLRHPGSYIAGTQSIIAIFATNCAHARSVCLPINVEVRNGQRVGKGEVEGGSNTPEDRNRERMQEKSQQHCKCGLLSSIVMCICNINFRFVIWIAYLYLPVKVKTFRWVSVTGFSTFCCISLLNI
jgi:hypothetical protein